MKPISAVRSIVPIDTPTRRPIGKGLYIYRARRWSCRAFRAVAWWGAASSSVGARVTLSDCHQIGHPGRLDPRAITVFVRSCWVARAQQAQREVLQIAVRSAVF